MMVVTYSQQTYSLGTNQPLPPQPQYQPQSMYSDYIYVKDPLYELDYCTGVLIKQQPEFLEAMIGCETENIYHVLGQTQQGVKFLFKCQEKSNCFMRNCIPSAQRSFNMDIFHITSPAEMTNFSQAYANVSKPFKCTICCLCRPEIVVTLNINQKIIGKMKHTFTLCDPEFEIYDENNQLKYIVTAYCCQCGLLLRNKLCGKLSEVEFDILNPGQKGIIGKILKKTAEYSELLTDADSYQIHFPATANPYEKLLIIALGLMIDYQYFETDSSDEKKKREKNKNNI